MRLSNCSGRKSPTAGPRGCKESTKPGPARHGPATARRSCRVGWHCAPRRRPSAAKHGQVPNRRCGKRLSVLHGHCCQRRRPHGQGGSGCHSSHFAGASDLGRINFCFHLFREKFSPSPILFSSPASSPWCCPVLSVARLHAPARAPARRIVRMRSCSCHEGGKLGLPALVRAVACFTALPLTLVALRARSSNSCRTSGGMR